MKSLKLKKAIMALLILITMQSLTAQTVEMIDKGNGTCDFYSSYPESELHFYLFGDGFHSFDKNPSHTYDSITNMVEVKFFTSRPYDDNDVEEELVDSTNIGNLNVSRVPEDFKNKVEVLESWNLVNSKENYFIVKFENIDSTGPISGCVEWHFNNTELKVNEGEILDNYDNDWVSQRTLIVSDYSNEGFTHKYVWNYSNLEYNEQRYIYIHVECLQTEMEKVTTRGILKVNSCQFVPYNPNNDGSEDNVNDSPHFTAVNIVRGYPHDPNCIHPDPYALTLLDEEQTIKYKIYFQNDGSSDAKNVTLDFIIYAIPDNLSYLASSDNCIVNQLNAQRWNIYFPNINLPGMKQQPQPLYENTIGWVELEACFDLALLVQDWIYSDVDIYFDFQPPVTADNTLYRILDQSMQSNCTQSGIKLTSTSDKKDHEESFEVFPNPCEDFINIIPPEYSTLYKVLIMDSYGKIVYRAEGLKGEEAIPMNEFPSGIYFVKTEDKGRVHLNRIFKH